MPGDLQAPDDALNELSLQSPGWNWRGVAHAHETHEGRDCVAVPSGFALVTVDDLVLRDGVIEADLCVGAVRSFHGLVWRVRSDDAYESFFVRPHQVGNPDAIQYTPVFNDISGWQLYHGEGFWQPVRFPIGTWFTIRIAFADDRCAVWLDGADEPLLTTRLRRDLEPGCVGLLVGGDDLRIAGFRYSGASPALPSGASPATEEAAIREWLVSEPFREESLPRVLAPGFLDERTWVTLAAEPSGLVNLARAHPIVDGKNTVLVRRTIESSVADRVALDFGYSDRARIFLNGEPLYRGNATYRSRDYRFLGSIGYFDTVYLPLVAGRNELVLGIAEDFGGWGVQARLRAEAG